MELILYRCRLCGNVVAFIRNSSIPIMCCGEEMEKIILQTTDKGQEKHVPIVSTGNGKFIVTIGAEPHPMTEEHYIEWIAVQTSTGCQFKCLCPGSAPCAEFVIDANDQIERVFSCCNIHGFWVLDM